MSTIENGKGLGDPSRIQPDVNFLQGLLEKEGIEVRIPREVRTVEEMLKKGVPVLDYSPLQPELPSEQYLLHVILKQFSGDLSQLPQEMVDYLDDRGYIEIPPTVRSEVRRRQRQALRDLTEATNQILDRVRS
jgi:hypothetical protein